MRQMVYRRCWECGHEVYGEEGVEQNIDGLIMIAGFLRCPKCGGEFFALERGKPHDLVSKENAE